MQRGHAHRDDVPLPGEADRPYPNRAIGYLGMQCAACPERGVNMPSIVNVPRFLRHLVSQHVTIDGNYKNNMFFKRDDGSDTTLTDGNMHFPPQKEYEQIAKEYVIAKEDKYGNVAISGVVGTDCDHAVVLAFVDMLVGEAFVLGTYAQREGLRHTNSPPRGPESATPLVVSYDIYCSFVVNQLKRTTVLFPKDSWFHEMLEEVEGQIPADHINGHGPDCQCVWQVVYFACRAHFHGETVEMIWGFLNPLRALTRQMTGGARHDTINFVIDAWNTRKVLRQAELLAGERADALWLFELHMAVLEDLSRQHSTEVGGWSRLSQKVSKSDNGKLTSVYQHQSTKVLTIENVLASLLAVEQEQRQRLPHAAGSEPTTSLAQWVRDGMDIERQQVLVIAFLKNHRQHPLQETWNTITRRTIYPRLTLSALDVNEPELTAIQLPSFRMKHGQRTTTDATDSNSQLCQAEIKLRCSEVDSGILAVRAASLALSTIRKARELDYHGQVGITRLQRNIQNTELMKFFEMDMYNKARAALTHLGHMPKDATEPYPPLTLRDMRRKETHLHRMQGDSRLFNGTAWYLQSGGTVHSGGFASSLSPVKRRDEDEGQPQFMTGTQTLKRAGSVVKSPRAPKRLKDIIPDDVAVDCPVSSGAEDSDLDMSPSEPGKLGRARGERKKKKGGKGKKKRGDGWIWLESVSRGVAGEGKLAEYKQESDRVQWFRAEAEMYRWLEAYERKHAELFRVIARFCRDSEVWTGRADRDEMENGGLTGTGAFARIQAAMYQRLQHNAEVHFRSPESGAHHDWVTATSFDELVAKVDSWRDGVFSWMDGMELELRMRLWHLSSGAPRYHGYRGGEPRTDLSSAELENLSLEFYSMVTELKFNGTDECGGGYIRSELKFGSSSFIRPRSTAMLYHQLPASAMCGRNAEKGNQTVVVIARSRAEQSWSSASSAAPPYAHTSLAAPHAVVRGAMSALLVCGPSMVEVAAHRTRDATLDFGIAHRRRNLKADPNITVPKRKALHRKLAAVPPRRLPDGSGNSRSVLCPTPWSRSSPALLPLGAVVPTSTIDRSNRGKYSRGDGRGPSKLFPTHGPNAAPYRQWDRATKTASRIECRILRPEMGSFSWNRFRSLSSEIGECTRCVKDIHTAVELILEAERRRRLAGQETSTQPALAVV
ncbi:hypothetical protein DFH08DRAFT_815803 [Mycena albidolilacea]|uniref:Uncharacterized protein n=1 Tax=Mycena albidolilacea TaxID=1033008 RepID=A0AAD7EJX4_9AGAR|nr:hypothetical protein DFH08DRAFT_815803 [Mycena albidolilacea]